jgi:2-polyprenyl-3-methyl-5-hydroxy-6-metoxy-1,4-benzoquinol methylase
MTSSKNHWENIFTNKADNQKSWFEDYPYTSMKFIYDAGLPKDAAIIDVGGGDSKLVDALLDAGYTNITVLDISAKAVENAKKRLGKRSETVKWIVSDVLDMMSNKDYDCWHDRTVFHFVTEPKKIDQYIQIMANSVKPTGSLIIGTFGENGPEKCSGLQVLRYSQAILVKALSIFFHKVYCIEKHITLLLILHRLLHSAY